MVEGEILLDYNALDPANPAHGQHVGILLVELGVGTTVFGHSDDVLYLVFARSTKMILLAQIEVASAGTGVLAAASQEIAHSNGATVHWLIIILMMTGIYMILQSPTW